MYIFPKRRKLEESETSSSPTSEVTTTTTTNQIENNYDLDGDFIMAHHNNVGQQHNMTKFVPFNTNPVATIEMSMPYFAIQCNWDEILKKNKGKVWASVRREGENVSSHAELISENSINNISSTESFLLPKASNSRYITIQDQVSHYQCSFIAPVAEYNDIHKSSVVSLDVSEGGLGVSADTNNVLKIWETDTGNVRRTLVGHVGDVYSTRFFPSGVVLLSTSADMSIKIWSAEDGKNPVTLRGHTGSVTDTCIIERGRNIISVSKDGTAKLWDCGMSSTLATLVTCDSQINSCCLSSPSVDMGLNVQNNNEREIGTPGKLLLLACEDSKVRGIGVASRTSVFSAPVPSPANSVQFLGNNCFAVGCQGGEIATFDLRKIAPPRIIKSVTPTPILSLMAHPRSPSAKPSSDESSRFVWASKSDGTVILVDPSLNTSSNSNGNMHKSIVQLTGSDFHPIYSIKHDNNYIYTACRDGLIRKYAITHVKHDMI